MATHHKYNSFDTLRIAGSLIVLIGHGFIITGRDAPTLGSMPIHSIGVCIFFVVSGYLITQSWLSDPNPVRYLSRRVLRIVPALIVVSFVTALVVGPIMSTEPLTLYLRHPWVYRYALSNSAMITVWSLPGVFQTLPLQGQANGSLWTLPIEFSLYLMVPLFALGRRRGRKLASITMLMAGTALVWTIDLSPTLFRFNLIGIDVGRGLALAPYFWAGSALQLLGFAHWPGNLKRSALIVASAIVLFWIVFPGAGHTMQALSLVAVAVLILSLGLSERFELPAIHRFGDLSYGTYLWAFPIQQSIFQVTRYGPFGNIVLSMPIVFCLAILSWRLVEKPALRLKPRHRENPAFPQDDAKPDARPAGAPIVD